VSLRKYKVTAGKADYDSYGARDVYKGKLGLSAYRIPGDSPYSLWQDLRRGNC
jgi:hypothetical protein